MHKNKGGDKMENKDLVLTTNDITKDIIKQDGRFNAIITKAGDPNARALKTITEEKLQEIAEFMPEVNRAVAAFSKTNSQTTASLMTLNMLEAGPYRVLRQILAQVERKRDALKENIYKLEEKKLEHSNLGDKIANPAEYMDKRYTEIDKDGKQTEIGPTDKQIQHQVAVWQLERDKIASDTVDATTHIEAALKELGAYKQRYEEIRKNNNIPEDWDEEDFEDAEIEHHIKVMYRSAVRDFMVTAGRGNMATFGYSEAYGIHPMIMMREVGGYYREINRMIDAGEEVDINTHYNFLDAMYEKHKNDYKKAMKRIGLDSITHADWLMRDNK